MLPRINEAFAGRNVFITGASGFLGKVLIEKLLYSVPDIGHIFIIVRPAKGHSPRERWEKLTENILFDRLRGKHPERLQKVQVIEGDLMEENLGMNQHDVQRICDEVSVVFHCAATVKFDEKLREAVNMNVRGTMRVISLCHKMNKLVSLVHCSTAYANCDRQRTEEHVYPPPINPMKLIEAMEWMDDAMLESVTPRLLGKRPNTYTLTKALAEGQLMEDAAGLPVIIFRPSIVTAMWKDQLPGWIDNVNGPTGLLAAVGKGVLTNMCGDVDAVADIIPVDIVSNMLIASAVYRMATPGKEIPVVHCTSGQLNPVKWNTLLCVLEQMYHEHPMEQSFGVTSTYFHKSTLLFEVNHQLKHEIPARLLDYLCILLGRKATYSRLYSKVRTMVHALEFFTTRGWQFDSKGLPMLWESLQPEDRKTFNFDVRQVDWVSYLFDYVMGVKKYITREKIDDPKAIAHAQSNMKKLQRYRFYTRVALCYAFARLAARYKLKNHKWTLFFGSFFVSQFYTSLEYRPVYRLKTLEEYMKTASNC